MPTEPPTTADLVAQRKPGKAPAVAILDAWLANREAAELATEAMVSNMTPEMAATFAEGRAYRAARLREHVERREWEAAFGILGNQGSLGPLSDWWQFGCLTLDELRAVLPGVWSGAEPDDTDPLWRRLWTAAAEPGRLETGDPLPEGDPLVIYRGEPEAPSRKTRGIAWTLDRAVAVFFALRPPWSDGTGVVIEGRVPRSAVLGYVTDRQESEVIVATKHVKVTGMTPVTEADRPPRVARLDSLAPTVREAVSALIAADEAAMDE